MRSGARAAWLLVCIPLAAAVTYQSQIAEWRRQREASLKAEGGWLSVNGLYWLHAGANRFGSGSTNDIVLPTGARQAGIFTLRGTTVTAQVNGASRALRPDSDDALTVARLKLFVIQRGDRYGIRLKDPQSPMRREFQGLEYFPTREQYRVIARFVPDARKIPIANIIGQTEPEDSPGYVVFQLQGRQLRLTPVYDDPGSKNLFFMFKDETSGKESYGAGRFLDTDPPHYGRVVLDFNKAYNPPCAFTPYATCPLPPKENRLAVRIEAGEKTYGHAAPETHSN